MNFSEMNETDVREAIVRPFLERLGYKLGTANNIRTEQTFRYAKAFLGRKNPKKDPDLVGRADYILEVAGYDRWVVEVKGLAEAIGQDEVEQAHTYAAHPEVGAAFFLLTNGRSFALYRTGSLKNPLMAWELEEGDEVFLAVSNLIGPDAIRRRADLLKPDLGKPLGKGLPSSVQIIGGHVTYEDHESSLVLMPPQLVNGLELPVTGGSVGRGEDGRILALVKVAQALAMFREIADVFGRAEDGYDFLAADEYISTDPDTPTIFTNFVRGDVAQGTPVTVPGMGPVSVPFNMGFGATTRATGFVQDTKFMGTMEIAYDVSIEADPFILRALEQQLGGSIPKESQLRGGGRFEIELRL